MKQCHFIGIGGIGMSGLARILLHKNIQVSGSDTAQNYMTKALEKAGATIYIGHDSTHVPKGATVIYTSGIKRDNPELLAAMDLKCHLLHRSDLLKQIMADYETLAVAGTHGKTTTTSLLTAVLVGAGLDPSFAVGGVIPQFETNALMGKGKHFIAEADESDGTFLKYHPQGAILTNIDLDHMDYFGAIETVISTYKTFISQVKDTSLFFWCADDARLNALIPPGVSYGFNETADLRASNFRQEGWLCYFDIDFEGCHYSEVELALVGSHNALNALAVFGMARRLGIHESDIRKAFRTFGGVNRRCEKKGSASHVLVLDDYAHHPEEIRVTIQGIRNAVEEKRLIVVFQPHRYTRTRDCLSQFEEVFKAADLVYITDIYSAGEAPIDGISHLAVADLIPGARPILRKDALETLFNEVRPHDVIVTMGAGDITTLGPNILEALRKSPLKPLRIGMITGGRSGEHEVALRSAKFIEKSLLEAGYAIETFVISKEGLWDGESMNASLFKRLDSCDVLFPVLHGPYGEDGTIQGFFEMLGKPYAGCNHRACAVAMDKVLTKRIVLLNGIATSPFIDFNRFEWQQNPMHFIEMAKEQLHFPVFVKPVHLGSSLGVQKVEDILMLPAAINEAFKYDNRVLIENGMQIREIEFAVFGNTYVHVTEPGEIFSNGKVYDYEAKYSDHSFDTAAVAELPQAIKEEGIFLAETAYKAIECEGFARVDFFLDSHNRWWFNEINPIPGFTELSLYPMMCKASGIKGDALMHQFVISALERARSRAISVVAP